MTRVLKKADKVITRRIADETLLVPVRGKLVDMNKLYALDATAEFIWGLIDGKNALADIRDAVVAEFEVGSEQAEGDLTELVQDLLREGMITEV